jgi:biopolymer transport protein ExbD
MLPALRRDLPQPAERVPNLAPMVDVIMVILVFFLLGASLQLAREGVLQTQLDPRSGPGEGTPIEIIPSVRIALEEVDGGADCRVYVMGAALADDRRFERLYALLDRKRREGADVLSPVVIASQPAVQWKFVVRAMDAAVRAGFHNVQFAVRLGGGVTAVD